MKKLLFSIAPGIALAFSLILWWGCNSRPKPGSAGPGANSNRAAATVKERIDSLLKTHFAADGPALVVSAAVDSIVYNDGDRSARAVGPATLYSFSTGVENFSSRKPVTTRSVFNIGSLTKQFTAHAVLWYAKTNPGLLSDPIGKYLTGLHPGIGALTIDQLLSHCSGIPDHYGFTDTNKVKHASDRDVLEAIRKADTLYFKPGTRYRYSNTAYCLLGMLLEKLSGTSYEQLIRSGKTLDHCLLNKKYPDLSFLPASSAIGERITGYEKDSSGKWSEADAPESIFFTTQADGGLLISMQDYMQWCDCFEFGRRPEDFPEFQPHTLVDTAAGLYYGYGWFVLPGKNGAGPLIYHTGFNGGFRTSVLLIPKIHYRIAIFSASPGVDLEELVHQIDIILGIDDKGFIKSGPLES